MLPRLTRCRGVTAIAAEQGTLDFLRPGDKREEATSGETLQMPNFGRQTRRFMVQESQASCSRRQGRRQREGVGAITFKRRPSPAAAALILVLLVEVVALPEHPETGSTTNPCPLNNNTYQVVCHDRRRVSRRRCCISRFIVPHRKRTHDAW